MAESFSFDVVSDFDRQELVNTLDQVKREISQRYDLKGTDTSIDLEKENIFIITNSELTLNAVNDIIRQKDRPNEKFEARHVFVSVVCSVFCDSR